mmetsp:Transcript_73220/g.156870  ORF Transcript_73220/g.156870 Transcript_73220/m.156870 type:complete len:223 (-) Transcript_73220:110-778(-)
MEGRQAGHDLVDCAAHRPSVRALIATLVLDDFLGHELRRPHVVFEDFLSRRIARAFDVRILEVLRRAKVDDLHDVCIREHDVLTLQISVHYPGLAHVVQRIQHLGKVVRPQGPRATHRLNHVPQLATLAALHDHKHRGCVGEPCQHLHDVDMIQSQQAMLFHDEVCGLLQACTTIPVHHLHSEDLASRSLLRIVDGDEGPASKELPDLIVLLPPPRSGRQGE